MEKLTNEEVKNRIIKIHGDKYGLDKVNWINTSHKITLTCPKHGDFQIFLSQIEFNNAGCPKCYNEQKCLTNEKIIEKAKQIHGDKYTYNHLNYISKDKKILVTCPKHGNFSILVSNFINHKQGCPKCNNEQKSLNQTYTKEKFIEISESKNIPILDKYGLPHYDYSNTIYTKANEYVIIRCLLHGEFKQIASAHMFGNLCPECGKIINSKRQTKDLSILIKELQNIYGDKYDYSLITKNVTNADIIPIICKKHNLKFYSSVQAHLYYGKECPICKPHLLSKPEISLRNFIASLNIDLITNYRNLIGKEIDIYITSKKIGIEFDGIYWHSELFKDKNYHIQKTIDCENKGVRLIHIFENEWNDKQEIIKSRLRQILGFTKYKIPARKCNIKIVNPDNEKLFFDNNHLQGYIPSMICYGLYFEMNNKEYLVACMSFGNLRKNLGQKHQDNVYELYRFACLKNFSVIGGASKLFKYFINRFNPLQVISYADRRWSIDSENNLYRKLGFTFDSYTTPNYYYLTKDYKVINRFSMRKDILVSKFNADSNKSEKEITEEMGLHRIYDCGNLKYFWSNKVKK